MVAIESLMEHETAGDPMSGLKWTKKTLDKVAVELAFANINVIPNTVGRILKGQGFSLRVNEKRLTGKKHPDRDKQFGCINSFREQFTADGDPIISVDTKKRELVGKFRNAGQTWQQKPLSVNEHDFRSDAEGVAIPYGVFDLHHRRGFVMVGISHNTPAFAADGVAGWWEILGSELYPGRTKILILCDSGGANDYRYWAWKLALQERVCDRFGLTVTVSHYPPGASKYNPCDHRLFSEISKNWAGRPLETYETVLKYIESTRTKTGLRVAASLNTTFYATGLAVPEEAKASLAIERHKVLPKFNYTLFPRAS